MPAPGRARFAITSLRSRAGATWNSSLSRTAEPARASPHRLSPHCQKFPQTTWMSGSPLLWNFASVMKLSRIGALTNNQSVPALSFVMARKLNYLEKHVFEEVVRDAEPSSVEINPENFLRR